LLTLEKYQLWRQGLYHLDTALKPEESVLPNLSPYYFPFTSRADADFAEWVASLQLPDSAIDDLLLRLPGWCSSVNVSFKSHLDIRHLLNVAKQTTVQVRCPYIGSGALRLIEILFYAV
jgi:hypothetical protein